MYWTGKGGPRFIRPIRWIVALLGDDVVPFELAGVRSGNTTSGHRLLGQQVDSGHHRQLTSRSFARNGVILSRGRAARRGSSRRGRIPDVVRG